MKENCKKHNKRKANKGRKEKEEQKDNISQKGYISKRITSLVFLNICTPPQHALTYIILFVLK